MASYIQGLLPGSQSEQNRMLRNFSLNEFGLLAGTYKHMFKDQMRTPTAENNHIINYNLKLQNYIIVNSSIHMISAGMFTFLVRGVLGVTIGRFTLNYLGAKKQYYATLLIYMIAFYMSFSWLNNSKRLNVNHLINPRDFNGEIMMNLTLKYFPKKVNQEKFRQAMMAKYEGQLLKISSMEQLMGQSTERYQLNNPGAVTNYVAENQVGVTGQTGASQGMPDMMMPQNLNMPSLPHFGNPGSISNPLAPQIPQPQGPPQISHAQDHHLKQILAANQHQQQLAPQNPQQQTNQQPIQDMEKQRTRIVDQLRSQHEKSPYLSTNPLMTPSTLTAPGVNHSSPYLSVSQEISSTNAHSPTRMQEAMDNYYMQNIAELQHIQQQQQSTGYKYQGHYFNVAQQARQDSS